MGRIEIPKRMENQFKTLVICLRALTRPENMVLAGGTTLEMLWKHRDSTDIDLFVSNRTLIEISQAGKEAKTRGNRSTKGQNSERPAAESGSRDAEMNTLEIVGLALCNRVVEMHLEKACAGMRIDHPERMESIGSRIRENRLEDEDKAVLRWAISGMRDGDVKSMLAWGGIQAKEFKDAYYSATTGKTEGLVFDAVALGWCEEDGWIPPRGMLFCKTREEIPKKVVRLKDQGAESGRLEDEKVSWFEILPGAEIAVLDELWEGTNAV